MSGKSKQPSETTQKVVNEPHPATLPFVNDILSSAQAAYRATPQQAFGGELTARMSPETGRALQMITHNAERLRGAGDQFLQYGKDLAAGNFMDPDKNRFLNPYVDSITRAATQAFGEGVVPQLQSQAISQGAYGGSRDDVTLGLAADRFQEDLTDQISGIYLDQYNREADRRLQSGNIINQAADINLRPAGLIGQAGETREGYHQNLLDEQFQRYQMQQQAPWAGLNNYASIIHGSPYSSGTTSGTASRFGQPAGGRAIQGALGAGALGAGLFGSLSSAGALGAGASIAPWLAIPAALGGISSGLF